MTRYRDFWVHPKRPKKGTSKARRRQLELNARLSNEILEQQMARPEIEAMIAKGARELTIFGETAVMVRWDPAKGVQLGG